MKKVFTLSLLCIFCFSLYSQPNSDRREKMEERIQSIRIAFITDRLELTPEESQGFWPVYNEFNNALDDLKKSENLQEPSEEMTEEEASIFLEQSLRLESRELALKHNYIDKLKNVIPVKKVAKLHYIERAFKKEMLNRVKRRTGNKEKQKRKN